MSKPQTLYKQKQCKHTLEQELTISVKQLLGVIIFTILFLIFIFVSTPQTFGFF